MAALEEAFIRAASLFKILELNVHQKRAIQAIVVDKKDVFVNLPTGFGKSLIYQALPFVFDHVKKSAGHIVVVVSPLGNLRTTTKFTTTTFVDWEKTETRTSVSAGKRKVKMRSVGRSTTTTLNVNTDVKL